MEFKMFKYKILKVISVLILIFIILGCVPMQRGTKEYQDLCYSGQNNSNIFTTFKVDEKIVYFSPSMKREFYSKNVSPISETSFFIRIRGGLYKYNDLYLGDFKYQHIKDKLRKSPILYYLKDAYVELEDGTIIKAENKIYSAHKDGTITIPGKAFAKNVIDFNTLDSEVFFIKFDIPPPSMKSKWKIFLGFVIMDNHTFKIPNLETCYQENTIHLHLEPIMRP